MSQLTRIATAVPVAIAAGLLALTPATAATGTVDDAVVVLTDTVEAATSVIGDLPTCWEWCTK